MLNDSNGMGSVCVSLSKYYRKKASPHVKKRRQKRFSSVSILGQGEQRKQAIKHSNGQWNNFVANDEEFGLEGCKRNFIKYLS